MIKFLKDFTLPIAIVLGFIFHQFFAKLSMLIPMLIFVMLYVTLCGIDIKKMKLTGLHWIILAFQIVVSAALYFMIKPFNETLGQGVLVLVLAPTATSAPVIAAMLGANLSTMVTSTLISNVAVAFISPFYFSVVGYHTELSFFQSIWMVLYKITPLILFPLILAILTQRILPQFVIAIKKQKNLSYYIWAISLTLVIGRTIHHIFEMDSAKHGIILSMMITGILLCAVQFAFGRLVGKRYGDVVAGGQSIGQKNTVLSIWMAQTYLNPLSSVVPASYVLWQNLFNSYQIWMKKRKDRAK